MANKISRRGFIKSSLLAGAALAGAALGFGFDGLANIRVNNRFDTIIKNGVIYSGNLREPVRGDLGIKNGKISAIGDLGESADITVDAGGKAISPGFIDIHTHTDSNHTDSNLFDAPLGDSKIYQGVTLDIGGNCGDSPFPSQKWESAGKFFDDLRSEGRGINYGSFLGQGSLRSRFVGDNNVPATAGQLKDMKRYIDI